MIKNNRGNTIIEVLIATLVIGTVMTAIAIGMTYSIKNTSEAQYREVGTSLASEPIEVLRHLRASFNWYAFSAALGAETDLVNAGGYRYGYRYIDTATVVTDPASAGIVGLRSTLTKVTVNSVEFTRKLHITVVSDDQITVQSVVSWSRNGTIESDVTLEQSFFNTQPR